MKTKAIIFSLFIFLLFTGCSKDDTVPQQQQENQVPELEPVPENQSPDSFSATTEVNKNTAQLNWTAPEDPDGDTITYSIMLGDSLIATQTETSLDLTGLIFEKDYDGKIIADDGNEHQVETSFSFTTGFLWLAIYEGDNGSGNFTSYEYNESDFLITTIRHPEYQRRNVLYDANNRVFSIDDMIYNHNTKGLLTSISDGTGHGDLEFLYDDQDRVRELRVTRTSDANNYEGVVIMSYNYNTLGNLTSLYFERSHTSDNTGGGVVKTSHRRRLSHDNDGNVVEFTFEESEDGITYTEKFRESFIYDDKKNPWSSIVSNQLTFDSPILYGLRYDFDPHGIIGYNLEGYSLRLYRGDHNITNYKLYVDGNLNTEHTYEYAYNETGYPISAKWSTGNQEFFPRWTYHE